MNSGIYATLAEQFTLALLVGILALATPSSPYSPFVLIAEAILMTLFRILAV